MKPTAQQQRAIDSNAPNTLCCASPGAGKSGVVVERIKRLVREGTNPDDIAVILYTNNSSKVIYDRLHPEDGTFAINVGSLSTLHSFCLRHLQEFGGMRDVTVLDDEEANEELVRCARQAGVKASEAELIRCRENWAKESTLSLTPVRIAVASYYRRMQGSRTLDYNAILTTALEHLREKCPNCDGSGAIQIQTGSRQFVTREMAIDAGDRSMEGSLYSEEKWEQEQCEWCATHQRHWKHLIIDESQDHGALDFEIFNAISTENRFIVGDVDQSAFGFRGANPHIIVELSKDPQWETILLEGNFRSVQPICDVAQRLIEHNTDRVPKRMISMR